MPNTYAIPTTVAATYDPVAPDSPTTPARTGAQHAIIATPSASINPAPTRNTSRWSPMMKREITDAPRAMGMMMVATPSPKMNVMATSARRWRKVVARYAGSITEMQHGAKSATTPATNAAMM